jgi:xylulokinase
LRETDLSEIRQVRASGGGAKSALWLQIMADVLGVELSRVNTTEGAAFGAALLAGVGAEIYQSVQEACDAVIQVTDAITPGVASKAYRDHYPRYCSLYPTLTAEFHAIAQST